MSPVFVCERIVNKGAYTQLLHLCDKQHHTKESMVMGKYSRVDGRKPSIYCCTITVVVFVALCLVGAWMLMSSSVPVQNSNPLSQGNVNGVKQVAGENISKQFEESPGDLLEDARKEDSKRC
ncbi:hypothetical protein OIU76_007075 [Salix suchowensis]|nr:hypothetical protein OIU76_007075 [Salix suchowensis]